MTTDTENQTPAPWFIEEGVAGQGERPAWLPEKFKSAAEMGKSYGELEKKFGTAPEEYDLKKSKFLDADYVPFQELTTLAKEKRVPKEVIDKMVDSIDKYMDEFTVKPEEEFKKLGDNAKERLQVLDNWLKVNLPEKEFAAVTNNLKRADAILALEMLRGKVMGNNTMIPNGNDANQNNVQSVDELKAELTIPENYAKYKTDPKYRADWQGRLDVASKSSGVLDKAGP